MTVRNISSLALLLSLLMGCGDSSSSSPPVTGPTQPDKPYDNIHLDVTPASEFSGALNVYMGAWYPCSTEHLDMCLEPERATPIQRYSEKLKNNRMTRDKRLDEFEITSEKLNRFAQDTGLIPVNSNYFTQGNYSVLDAMIYVSAIRDDFELTLGEFDVELGTYQFTVSYDYNRDGTFSEADGAENYQSPDWYAAFLYSDGEWKRMVGTANMEPLYARLDQYLIRDDAHLRIQPFHPSMTARRQSFQASEVARLNATGGKLIVPEINVDFDDGRGNITIAKDVEVAAYNLRPDLIKPGVPTLIDAMMAADEQGQAQIEFTYWPTLSTKVEIDSYVVTSINGQRASGFSGWFYTYGELEAEHDFFWTPLYPFPELLVMADEGTLVSYLTSIGLPETDAEEFHNGLVGQCSWLTQANHNKHTAETAKVCIDNWFGFFGGNHTHQMMDIGLLTYPKGAINFYWNTHQTEMFEVSQHNKSKDGRFEVYDINKAVAPLTQSHFGWKIADCGVCHSLDNTHLTGDAPSLPAQVEPYYCASCHGSNGAPQGHGENARCFWCHSEDQQMVNHGSATVKFPVSEAGCSGTTFQGRSLDGLSAPCADQVAEGFWFMAPHQREQNVSSYTEMGQVLTTSGNSDWNTDEIFPDPYSCVTCHPAD